MKALAAALISTLLFSAMAGILCINFVTAFVPPSYSISVTIQSPENKVYAQNRILVTFLYTIIESSPGAEPMIGVPRYRCFLDGKAVVPFSPSFDGSCYFTQISGLNDGSHSLKVYVDAVYENWMMGNDVTWTGVSDTVFFTVDTTAPRVSVLSLEQQREYNTNILPLDFSVSEAVTWMGYSLDGQAIVTIKGNMTLTGLSEGTHSIVVYATDTVGNTGESETVQFTITQETQQQHTASQQSEPFPTTMVAASATVTAIICVSLATYYKKTKRKIENSE